MKIVSRQIFLGFILFISLQLPLFSANGDTIHIITHNRELVVTDPSEGIKNHRRWGIFPDENLPVRKIMMHLRFACPDSMRCADWDYSDQIRIERKGGKNGTLLNYEIGRVITPYGGFFPKNWTFDWELDVTDFSLVLRDSVEINFIHSGYEPNNDRGWAVTIDFEINTGNPIARPISITEIYNDHFAYGDSTNPIDKSLKEITFRTAENAAFARFKVIQTGHGMDSPDNCAEFCSKYRECWFDGKLIQIRQMWKECGDNPLFPQAGTWIYDRGNWCPGYLVQSENFDFQVFPEKEHRLRLVMEPYSASIGNNGAQIISAYVIQYEKAVSNVDVSIEDVIVPSGKNIYSRKNPSGANAQIVVKNNGNEDITSLNIHYGSLGFEPKQFLWKGLVSFGDTVLISLPGLIQSKSDGKIFEVRLNKVNGKKDQYPADNQMKVTFNPAPVHDSILIFNLLTNKESSQNGIRLTSADGKMFFERKTGSLKPKTEYHDTLKLTPGAYQLALTDEGGDGLEFWFNREGGRGEARLLNRNNQLIKAFESDCGSGWIYNFTVGGQPDSIHANDHAISLYPSLTSDFTELRYFSNATEDVTVRLVSDPNAVVLEEHIYPQLKSGNFTYDLRRYPFGRFYLKVIVKGKEIFNKRIRFTEPEENQVNKYIPPTDSLVKTKLETWQDWKFGVIIHWGAYSQWGVVESWSLCPEDESWCIRRGPFSEDYNQYVHEYEQIRKTFNPSKFNPENWAEACRKAGMKYVVFTTKHHDGFCMFDSKYTDYKITDAGSVFAQNQKSNVAYEVFNAFRKQGLGIGAYFSKPDWHNDDYWWPYFPVTDRNVNYDPVKYPERWKNFQEFTYNQIQELMTGYGKIDILWLDGGWVRPSGSLTEETKPWLGKNQYVQDVNIPEIAQMARKNQAGLLVVDRSVHGEFENYRTPEQQIPDQIPDYPWESCITLGDSWYSTGPAEHYKSAHWAIQTLVKIVAKGGNFLLGIGPDKTGELVPEVYQRLEEIGKWMDVNAEAIYNSKPLAPYQSGQFCFTQSKDGKTRYAFYLLNENVSIPESLELPSTFVTNSNEIQLLGHSETLKIREKDGKYWLDLPKKFRKEHIETAVLVFRVNTIQ
ncbi:MAG: alpha-L-fucosidase [Bacteroidales bacterium]